MKWIIKVDGQSWLFKQVRKQGMQKNTIKHTIARAEFGSRWYQWNALERYERLFAGHIKTIRSIFLVFLSPFNTIKVTLEHEPTLSFLFSLQQ